MKAFWKVAKWPEGYVIVDIEFERAEPNAQFHPTRKAAQAELDELHASYAAWNGRGLADAPHMDAF